MNKKELLKWINYQYPHTVGNKELPVKIDQFENHIKEEYIKIIDGKEFYLGFIAGMLLMGMALVLYFRML